MLRRLTSRRLSLIVLAVLIVGLFGHTRPPLARATSIPAFPGAEGHGAYAVGGRGGQVIAVTNLNDSGPGSLRAALLTTGPRIVVFRVGGTIELQSEIVLDGPNYSYLTIAGQTAPGGGIQLKNYGLAFQGGIRDVIVRYIRVRPGFSGPEGGAARGGLSIYAQDNTRKNYNIIIDHSSFFWQQDDNAIWGPNYNITLQWNIFAEGIGNFVPGYENAGRKCLIIGQEGDQDQATNISIHHNYLANCDQRNLRLASDGPVEFVNNVIYNWGSISADLDNQGSGMKLNFIGNYYKPGPNSSTSKYTVNISPQNQPNQYLYVHDNIAPSRTNANCAHWSLMGTNQYAYFAGKIAAPTALQRSTPWAAAPVPVTAQPVLTAAPTVLDFAGANLPARDSADQRVVNDFWNGTGQLGSPNSGAQNGPNGAGGPWPTLAAGTAPADSDGDGMPDSWESANNVSSGTADPDNDGYTNIEEYLNGTNPNVAQGAYSYPAPTSSISANSTTTCGVPAPSAPTGRGISPTANNLVRNPGFESGTANWPDFGVGANVSLSSDASAGTQALRLGNDAALAQTFVGSEIRANTYYTLRAWGKVTGSGQVGNVWAQVFDANGASLGFHQLDFNRLTYEERYLSFVTPSNAAWIQVVVYNDGGRAYDFLVDQVQLSIGSLAPQQLNQVSNGGFEAGGAGWYLENAEVVSGNAQSGGFALRAGTGDAYVAQTVSAVAGASYTLKAWGKLSATGTNGTLGLRALNASGAILNEWTSDFTTTTYTERTFTITAPANTTQFLIYFYKPAGANYLYADSVSLLRNNPPNLILNPGFEGGGSNWNLYNTAAVVANNARSGANALATSGAGGADQGLALVGGAAYRFLVWGKIASANEYNDVTLYIRDAQGVNLQVLSLNFTEANYTPKGFIFTAPANATQMSITYWKSGTAATLYLDDFSLTRE